MPSTAAHPPIDTDLMFLRMLQAGIVTLAIFVLASLLVLWVIRHYAHLDDPREATDETVSRH